LGKIMPEIAQSQVEMCLEGWSWTWDVMNMIMPDNLEKAEIEENFIYI